MINEDRMDALVNTISPFMLPRRRKSMAISTIDNIVLQKTADSLKGEIREEVKADLSFKYDDEIFSENVGQNFAKLFLELIGRLKRWDKVTLEEYNAILEVRFGMDIYKNRDYYSFLTHLAGKKEYSLKAMQDNAETFLEGMVMEHLSEDQIDEYIDMAFQLEFEDKNIQIGEDFAEITSMIFIKK